MTNKAKSWGSDPSLFLNYNYHHLPLSSSTPSFDSHQTGISVLVYGFLISSRHLCRVCYWPASRCTPAVDETRVYYQFTRKSLFLACNLPTLQLSVWSRINPCISLTNYSRPVLFPCSQYACCTLMCYRSRYQPKDPFPIRFHPSKRAKLWLPSLKMNLTSMVARTMYIPRQIHP